VTQGSTIQMAPMVLLWLEGAHAADVSDLRSRTDASLIMMHPVQGLRLEGRA
jgi:hypothetical protein